jgi:glyoxylase-like metal-dependent hydrolase (beta-lactamase superfamily II)
MRCFSVAFLVALLAVAAIPATAADPELPFRVQRLTDRVLVFTELSPWESNHVVIVGAEGLVLVDPGHTELMGRLIRQAVREEIGRDRFAYVIDTHGHWGHTWGNAAFPEAVVVGHERALQAMEADAPNRQPRAEFIRGQLEEVEGRLAELDAGGEEARAARLQRDHFDLVARGLGETGFRVQSPRLTFSERLRLDLGDLGLEMHYLGRGHSDSDIVVLIPEEKVLLLGCFFLEQGPLPVFGTQTTLDPERWLEVLDRLLDDAQAIEHVVLGQHTVWSRERLVAMRDYIGLLWSEVQKLDQEGVDLETAIGRLPLPPALDFLRQAGATDEDLDRFHRFEITALWRQLKESAAAVVEQAIDEGGTEAGMARGRALVARDDPDVYFDETELNLLGYRFLGQGRVDEAIAVFQLNVERFPDSWNVYDSLGEAYAAQGDTERAIELYRHSLELNPDNLNGAQAIERLSADASEVPTEN